MKMELPRYPGGSGMAVKVPAAATKNKKIKLKPHHKNFPLELDFSSSGPGLIGSPSQTLSPSH